MQMLNFLRLLIAFQVGLFVSVSVTLLMCIVLAVHVNYFSGIDPASLIFELPWFWLLANLAGGSLLGGLRFFRVRAPEEPGTLLLLGLVLGMAPAGLALEMLTYSPFSWAISTIFVLATSLVVLLGDSTREPPAVTDRA